MRQAIMCRRLSGEVYGILDAFVVKLLEKLEEGEAGWHVKQKR